MKRYIWILILLITTPVYGQSKVTDLQEITTPETSDILYIIDDPAGSPVSRKITVGNVGKGITSTDLTDTADLLYETELDTFSELDAQIADETIVNTNDAQTLTNKTITFGGNTITMTESQLETAVSDDNPLFDGDIGSNVQAYDADLDDLADGSLTASKVAGVADADYGDISVSSGTWSVDANSISLSDMSDVGTVNAGAGKILIGDGINSYDSQSVSGDATLNDSGVLTIQANAIEESMLKAVDSANDEECLTYETTTGDFEWQSCGGGASALGDLSDVTITGAVEGDIIYYNGSAWVDLGRGSNGQVLKSTSTTIEWGTDSTGAGGGINTVKSDDAQVGDADIQTIDFASPLTVSESPDQEINVGLSAGLSDLTDVGTTTPTSGNILIGDGTNFDSVAVSGDATINSSGVVTVSNASTADALTSNPTDCSANEFANAIAADGDLTCAAIADADVPNTITIDLAATATALAANGGNCSAGNYPLGVDASGAVESCTADDDVPESGDFGNAADLESDGSLSADVVSTAEMADANFGDWTCSGGSCTVDNNVIDGANIALGSDAQGDVMFYGGTDYERLAPGTSGQFLQTQGAAADPQWASIPEEWSFAYTSPTDGDLILFYKAPYALTISDVDCIVDPADSSESVVIDIQECNSTGDSCVTIDATITCDNDGAADDGSLSNATIDAGDWVAFDVGTVTGTVTAVSTTVKWTKD
jgi:hypothetical protein